MRKHEKNWGDSTITNVCNDADETKFNSTFENGRLFQHFFESRLKEFALDHFAGLARRILHAVLDINL